MVVLPGDRGQQKRGTAESSREGESRGRRALAERPDQEGGGNRENHSREDEPGGTAITLALEPYRPECGHEAAEQRDDRHAKREQAAVGTADDRDRGEVQPDDDGGGQGRQQDVARGRA